MSTREKLPFVIGTLVLNDVLSAFGVYESLLRRSWGLYVWVWFGSLCLLLTIASTVWLVAGDKWRPRVGATKP